MTTQDPAAQLVGWLGRKAVEAIVARTLEPVATRVGQRLARGAGRAAIVTAKRRITEPRR